MDSYIHQLLPLQAARGHLFKEGRQPVSVALQDPHEKECVRTKKVSACKMRHFLNGTVRESLTDRKSGGQVLHCGILLRNATASGGHRRNQDQGSAFRRGRSRFNKRNN